MVDNDDYNFEGLDSFDEDSLGEEHAQVLETEPKHEPYVEKNNTKRNAIIAIVLIMLALGVVKLISYMNSGTEVDKITPEIPPVAEFKPPVVTTPAPMVMSRPVPEVDLELKRQVSAIENTQQTMKSEISTFSTEVTQVNGNVNQLNVQITKLNQTITDLANQVAKQSDTINLLMVRAQPKPTQKPRTRHYGPKVLIYNIKAVIPGRAWLVSSNGSTLTVREGSLIKGYGVVKLIDAMQGRVLTSSGRIIKFSQEDS